MSEDNYSYLLGKNVKFTEVNSSVAKSGIVKFINDTVIAVYRADDEENVKLFKWATVELLNKGV